MFMRRRASLGIGLFTKPGASTEKLALGCAMRRVPTRGEALLWKAIRRRSIDGWKFRRQAIIAGYIADFYCAELRLAVEVDGGIHLDRRADDEVRDADLRALGVRVWRISDADVQSRLHEVLHDLRDRCQRAVTSPFPRSRGKGRGRGPRNACTI